MDRPDTDSILTLLGYLTVRDPARAQALADEWRDALTPLVHNDALDTDLDFLPELRDELREALDADAA